ncbi:MAG: PD-(D/E)XK nuclease family protein [Oscillospiraceae bacterium]|nr:PD-(D/E)XK nuclease family protein [Oscillospiraceae bacterium]
MLHLITGRAGSGKSEAVARGIEARAKNGQRSILIVPEQSSFDAERRLTLRLGDALCPFCEVRSFRRLCADVFARRGGGARPRLSDAARCVLVRRAVASLGDDIVCYRRQRRDTAFFTRAASLIDELKNGGVSPEMLAETAQACPGELSRQKLRELSLIYGAYEAAVRDTFYDGAGELESAASLCPGAGLFAGRAVFLDGFSGFTQPEFSMIAAMAAEAPDVFCALGCDDVWSEADDALAAVRRTARRLLALAKRAGVPADCTVCEGTPRFQSAGLAAAERFFSGGRPQAPSADGVYAALADDLYAETEEAAAEILRLVREEGYDYGDIAVIMRDYARYKAPVERTFARCGIPFFSGETQTMAHSPVILFYLAALSLADGITTDGVTRLLRTSLTRMSDGDADELLSYAFVWSIDGGAWYAPCRGNPDGPDARPDDARLARIEDARARVADWVGGFIDRAKGADGARALREVYALLERCGALEKLENSGAGARAEAGAALALTEQLYEILDGEDAALGETRELLRLMAAAAPVRDIPPALQQVAVGSADRARTDNPRAVFVLGLNDGIFPHTSFDSPLLTFAERELLAGRGAELSRDFEHAAEMEELYLYRAVSAARERLYLLRAQTDGRGASLRTSVAVAAFLETNGANPLPGAGDPLRCAVSESSAQSVYAAALGRGDAAPARTLEASAYGGVCAAVRAAAGVPDFALRDTARLQAYLGKDLTLSASRIETFERCRFAYFLQYTMGVRPLRKAEMSPVEAGTFVHGVLESVLRALGGDLTSVEAPALTALAEEKAQAFLEARIGPLIGTDARLGYLARRLKAQAARLLLRLRAEQQQSLFRPRDFELKIGADVPGAVYETPGGERVRVAGSIDRVDVFEKDGANYVRVIDYKTGDKTFSLSDVYYGLNIQMLLYLFTVCGAGGRYGNSVPAGVLYMPADPRAPQSDDGDAPLAAVRAYRMDGLVLDDPAVVRAMERDGRGIFIPVETDADGNPKKDEKLASLEKLGNIKRHIDGLIVEMAEAVCSGAAEAVPIETGGHVPCEYCDYAAVCRRDRSDARRKAEKLDAKTLFCEGGGGNG